MLIVSDMVEKAFGKSNSSFLIAEKFEKVDSNFFSSSIHKYKVVQKLLPFSRFSTCGRISFFPRDII